MPAKKKSGPHIYEHLEHYVKNTTYTHRLKWLYDVNQWVRILQKEKIIPPRSSK